MFEVSGGELPCQDDGEVAYFVVSFNVQRALNPIVEGGDESLEVVIVITFMVARWIVRSLRGGWKQLKEKWA